MLDRPSDLKQDGQYEPTDHRTTRSNPRHDGRGQQHPRHPHSPDANAAAWSPDDSKIAFFSGFESGSKSPELNQQVSIINPDGTGRRTLTTCTPAERCIANDNPNWSPDGKLIFYDRAGDYPSARETHIWAMNADGTGAHELLPFAIGAGRNPWR